MELNLYLVSFQVFHISWASVIGLYLVLFTTCTYFMISKTVPWLIKTVRKLAKQDMYEDTVRKLNMAYKWLPFLNVGAAFSGAICQFGCYWLDDALTLQLPSHSWHEGEHNHGQAKVVSQYYNHTFENGTVRSYMLQLDPNNTIIAQREHLTPNGLGKMMMNVTNETLQAGVNGTNSSSHIDVKYLTFEAPMIPEFIEIIINIIRFTSLVHIYYAMFFFLFISFVVFFIVIHSQVYFTDISIFFLFSLNGVGFHV